MSVRGLVQSALYDKALRGDQTEVPIGAPKFTNNPRTMSEPVRLLIGSTELTEPKLEQIEAYGVDDLFVGRDGKNSSFVFDEEVDVNARRIVEAAFDSLTGELVLVRANKEELRIPDFLRADQIGRGPTGPRGPAGNDGYNARNGRDGKDGDTGCAGPQGQPGANGESGLAGKQGPIGRQGPQGCEGATGDTGIRGPAGPHGFEGARGLTGPSCSGNADGTDDGTGDSTRGVAGPRGLAFGEGVVFGTVAGAARTVAIIGLADDGIDSNVGAAPPVVPPATSVPVVPPPVVVPVTPPPTPTNPTPAPVIPVGNVTTCSSTSRLGSAQSSCGSNIHVWSSSFSYPGAEGPNGSKGVSTLYKANNTAWWPHSLILCSSFVTGAKYTFELTTPAKVSAQLFINCGVKLVSETGTTRIDVVATQNLSVRVRFYGMAQKIPVWFALVIKNDAGTIVYKTGQATSVLKIGNVTVTNDSNWFGNSTSQTIGM